MMPAARSDADRKLIEDAKALLIARNHMTEEEAHRYLQKSSMGQRDKSGGDSSDAARFDGDVKGERTRDEIYENAWDRKRLRLCELFAGACRTAKRDGVAVSDRHFGIGSDGLILIKPSDCADFEMEMYNADGSRGAMCGNGIRCVAKYVYDYGLTDKEQISVATGSGIKQLDLTVENGKVSLVKVDMGSPILEAEEDTGQTGLFRRKAGTGGPADHCREPCCSGQGL